MARGIDVVQAVLAGQRVRIHGTHWWHTWDASVGKFRREDGEMWCPSSRQLLTYEWDIEELLMTFTEAVAAMDAGQIVTREPVGSGRRGRWFRRNGSMYEVGGGPTTEPMWYEYGFAPDDIHATDWRVVPETEPTDIRDERPTRTEAASYLFTRKPQVIGWQDRDTGNVTVCWPSWVEIVEALAKWKPAMFREAP